MRTSRLALAVATALALNNAVSAETAVEIDGLLEIEATSGEKTSDITVATARIGLTGQVNDKVSTEVVLLHEAGEPDPIVIDNATVTLGFNDTLSLTAGQSYAPFGSFDSHMIRDPLTLELAETGVTLLQTDLATGPLTTSIYTFNGANTTDNEIDNWGVNLGYEAESFTLALGYIGNIGDTDGIANETIDNKVAGMSITTLFSIGGYSMIGEYITALDKFQPGDGNTDYALSKTAQPSAGNLELAYTAGATTFAVGMQRSEQTEAIGLPRNRTIAAISHDFMENTSLTLEYARDKDYADEESSMITGQIAVEF